MTMTAPWASAKQIIGTDRVTLGYQASRQWLDAPDHLAMVLARYRAAAALIGTTRSVLETGCGEGIGAGILARGRFSYIGIDTDAEALADARRVHYATPSDANMQFIRLDVLDVDEQILRGQPLCEAVVSLDVIEHIPAEHETAFMDGIVSRLNRHGVCVIGTPNKALDHLASPQSKAGHVNTYTHDRLHALMSRYFHTVQSFGMQDSGIHLGHPDARHYLLFCGIGPK